MKKLILFSILILCTSMIYAQQDNCTIDKDGNITCDLVVPDTCACQQNAAAETDVEHESWFRRWLIESTSITVGVDESSALGYKLQPDIGLLNEIVLGTHLFWRNRFEFLPMGKIGANGYHLSFGSKLYYMYKEEWYFGGGAKVSRTVTSEWEKTGLFGIASFGFGHTWANSARVFVDYFNGKDFSSNPWHESGLTFCFEGNLPLNLMIILESSYVHATNPTIPTINGIVGTASVAIKL